MTSLTLYIVEKLLQELKKQYPYIQNETNLKNALITIREREGIEGDFSEDYDELDEYYSHPTKEEIEEDDREMEEIVKMLGMADNKKDESNNQ